MSRTFLVECYWPGLTAESHAAAVARADDAARAMQAKGREVRFLEGLLVRADEVAFYRFSAREESDVGQACVRAELPYERISEYIAVSEMPLRPERGPARWLSRPSGGLRVYVRASLGRVGRCASKQAKVFARYWAENRLRHPDDRRR